jgi:hypothetical protein
MAYDYDSEKILVTLINVGDTAVIGEIIIAVGLVEREIRKGGIKFDIFGYAPVQRGGTHNSKTVIFSGWPNHKFEPRSNRQFRE